MATPDLSQGLDYSIRSGPNGDDLDLTFNPIYGAQVMLESAFKKVTTTAGSLWWAPSDTIDLTEQLLDGADSGNASALQSQIGALLSDDPRIQDLAVAVAYNIQSRVLSTSITETLVSTVAAAQPNTVSFELVVTPGSNSVDISRIG